MEGVIKVKVENDYFEEEEVDFSLIGGYDMNDTPKNDPLDLNIKVEEVKVEDEGSVSGNKFQDNFQAISNTSQINSEFIIKNEEMTFEENSDDNFIDKVENHDGENYSCSQLGNLRTELNKGANLLECNGAFRYIRRQQTHTSTRIWSSIDKSFRCHECGKLYSQSINLQKHMHTHMEDKRFKCNDCSKSFSRLPQLKRHQYKHTGNKPFNCKECNKTFSRSNRFKIHMYSHKGENPFKCNDCNETFPRSSLLKSHMFMHTGNKPFKCNECNKAFPRSSSLRRHAYTHTEDKPFKCNICVKSFTERNKLKIHVCTHTWGNL